MRSRVELFEQIRRDREFGGLSTHALARKYGVHRRTVRQALESPLPPPRKRPEGRPAPKLGEWRALIDSWLEADRGAPRKQRHTAKRIDERLRDEHGVEVSERQVRRYVRERRQQLGELVDEVFVPLCSEPGAEAEVDWGEATVVIAGVARKVHLFQMRACFSGACFVQAHTRETQQAFLEGHVAALEFFGGVFGLIRYDNLGSAVKRVLRGRRRVETDRFVALRSHYLYESSFTRVGKEGAHEKGGIEGDVGRFRRSYLVPVPEVGSLGELNDLIAAVCITDLRRTIRGRRETVGEALGQEIDLLRPLPAEPFDAASMRRRGWTASRWRPCGRTSTRCRSVSPACGSPPGSARARSSSSTTDGRSPAMSGCTGSSVPPRSWTTTSSCLCSSQARSPARSRCARSASGAPGRTASTSCGTGSRIASALQRPPGRWSTCCCSAANYRSHASSSRSVARSPPARTTAARSRSSLGALNALSPAR